MKSKKIWSGIFANNSLSIAEKRGFWGIQLLTHLQVVLAVKRKRKRENRKKEISNTHYPHLFPLTVFKKKEEKQKRNKGNKGEGKRKVLGLKGLSQLK